MTADSPTPDAETMKAIGEILCRFKNAYGTRKYAELGTFIIAEASRLSPSQANTGTFAPGLICTCAGDAVTQTAHVPPCPLANPSAQVETPPLAGGGEKCPKCASDFIWVGKHRGQWQVKCWTCYHASETRGSKEGAIQAWREQDRVRESVAEGGEEGKTGSLDNPRPRASELQQGAATPTTHVTLPDGGTERVRDGGNVAKPQGDQAGHRIAHPSPPPAPVQQELKACPFCGGSASVSGSPAMYYARCDNEDCFASTHGAHYLEAADAIEAWNTRRPAPAPDTGLAARIGELERKKAFTEQWYAERLVRLRKLADDNGLTTEHCSIVANGTASATEPPTYAQQLNIAKHRANKAEQRADTLTRQLEAANRVVEAKEGLSHQWADAACNGLQWLRNVKDGISDPQSGIDEMKSNIDRLRALWSALPPAGGETR